MPWPTLRCTVEKCMLLLLLLLSFFTVALQSFLALFPSPPPSPPELHGVFRSSQEECSLEQSIACFRRAPDKKFFCNCGKKSERSSKKHRKRNVFQVVACQRFCNAGSGAQSWPVLSFLASRHHATHIPASPDCQEHVLLARHPSER